MNIQDRMKKGAILNKANELGRAWIVLQPCVTQFESSNVGMQMTLEAAAFSDTSLKDLVSGIEFSGHVFWTRWVDLANGGWEVLLQLIGKHPRFPYHVFGKILISYFRFSRSMCTTTSESDCKR